jgi:PAS domain S-box-containing protein
VCTAIDITRSKRLDMMRTDLSRRLAETLQRFNLALRSERIMVFSQDLSLRYTWANSSETQVGSLIGRTDDEVLPPGDRDAVVSLKRGVIETKEPTSAEVGVGEGAERRWYDMHIEPNLSADGEVTGITCASIDITHRKRNEEQMRLVMRELTHRTKNLLTVVIAVARQTANQHTTVDAYVPALIARLRALSAAQDLIVADDWAGVDITDLVRVLVGQYLPPQSGRLTLEGPPLILSPEASQNLGLAIHELAANAAQYGALSNTTGTLAVTWRVVHAADGDQLALSWRERGGPAVTNEPTTRGFGMTVIERNLARALDAQVDLAFMREGLTAHVALPLRGVLPFASPDRVRIAEAS